MRGELFTHGPHEGRRLDGGKVERRSGVCDGCGLTKGLWIQMSPPLDSAVVRDQQCVTDRRSEAVVVLCCVDSNWHRLSSAWSSE